MFARTFLPWVGAAGDNLKIVRFGPPGPPPIERVCSHRVGRPARRDAVQPRRDPPASLSRCRVPRAGRPSASYASVVGMKGQQKPKKLAKKAPQKSLKEQRAAKAAKKKARG